MSIITQDLCRANEPRILRKALLQTPEASASASASQVRAPNVQFHVFMSTQARKNISPRQFSRLCAMQGASRQEQLRPCRPCARGCLQASRQRDPRMQPTCFRYAEQNSAEHHCPSASYHLAAIIMQCTLGILQPRLQGICVRTRSWRSGSCHPIPQGRSLRRP